MSNERRTDDLALKEKAYRSGLRRRDSDKVEAVAYYILLCIIMCVYGGFILGGVALNGGL